jgi:hypothetical protein
MKGPILLKKFNHVIFPSAVITAKETTAGSTDYDNHGSSLTADINFEQGTFEVKGDWHFLMTCNKHTQPEWFNYHTRSVRIDGSIYPSFTVDLNDNLNDGAVFILEGNIRDHHNTGSACSGLLILDKIAQNNNPSADTWNISFYLYDNSNEDCEIAFKIPVFAGQPNSKLN